MLNLAPRLGQGSACRNLVLSFEGNSKTVTSLHVGSVLKNPSPLGKLHEQIFQAIPFRCCPWDRGNPAGKDLGCFLLPRASHQDELCLSHPLAGVVLEDEMKVCTPPPDLIFLALLLRPLALFQPSGHQGYFSST